MRTIGVTDCVTNTHTQVCVWRLFEKLLFRSCKLLKQPLTIRTSRLVVALQSTCTHTADSSIADRTHTSHTNTADRSCEHRATILHDPGIGRRSESFSHFRKPHILETRSRSSPLSRPQIETVNRTENRLSSSGQRWVTGGSERTDCKTKTKN